MTALVILMVRRLSTADALRAFLAQDDAVAARLRPLLCEHGRVPSRRTWARRLATLPPSLPGVIGSGGRHVVALLTPWARHGRAVAVDGTALATGGGVWHKTPREQGVIPHASIAMQAGWRKAGWHGWWYGWKLHLAVTVGAGWLPRAAELTGANRGDTEVAPSWRPQLPGDVRDVVGDTHSKGPECRRQCQRCGGALVATRRGAYPHRDGGVEVRSIFHQLRSPAIEPCKGLFKNIFAWRVKMPVQGLQCSPRLALGGGVV
jgi:hypothetical protein